MSGGAIGFLLHPSEGDGALAGAMEVAARFGYRTWTTMVSPAEDVAEQAEGTVLLVTVGGDGTFLFGARLAAPRDIPVLGINRGRLGFLTDMELDELPAAIEAFAAGRTRGQRRSMLGAEIEAGERAGHRMVALNDIALKSPQVAVVRLHVEADGELLGEFDADGVVVASATGSTGYALSAGGPPIDPRVRAIIVVPIAPHAVITRPIVLPETTEVELTVVYGRVSVAADGQQQADLDAGGRVRVGPGPELTVVRGAHSPSFLRQLRDKVRFGLPLKPVERTEDEGHAPDIAPQPGGPPGAAGRSGRPER